VTETNARAPAILLANQAQAPLVSIILPTYNGSQYLSEAIESCLHQTYENWELILVDDCSTDATPQIIGRYVGRDPRIRSIRHASNKKLPEALNTGHAAAQGEYLMWTSDDNRLLPAAIEKMAKFLDRNLGVGLVYADCVIIDQEGRYVRDYPAEPASTLAYTNALGPCFLYRRAVYQTVGAYDTELFLAEDYDYWLRVYRQFDVALLPETLYEYRWHGQSLSNTAARSALSATVERTLRRNLPYLTRSSPEERARGWIVCAAAAARRRVPGEAANALIRALATAPVFTMGYLARKMAHRGSGSRSGAQRRT
jgi:glycosyltransferase involved in cell wall biosynthesis